MSLFSKNDKIQRWKYDVKFLNIYVPDKTTIEIPVERVKGLSITNNYEEYYFPLTQITVILDSETYYKIINYKNECKINIRIDKFYYTDEGNDKSIPKNYINGIFQLILDEGTDDMLRSLKEDEYKTNYNLKVKSIEHDLNKVVNELSFYIFKPIINNVKMNVNKLLVECNVADAIAYLATAGDINNILMGQPDNDKIYEEFFIPPTTILKALEFIDLYYGIYKDGSMIFFDYEYTYIIPYNGKCAAYFNGEIKTTDIIIPKSTNVDHKNLLGSIKKNGISNKYFILGDYSSINIQNQSISNAYINANNVDAIDSYEQLITTGESTAIHRDSGFTRITEDRTMNKFYTSMYANQSNSKSTVVSIRLQDFDLAAIAPNKEFNLLFEDMNYRSKYNGKYIVAGLSTEFIKETEFFGISSTIVLRKID